MNTPKYIIVHHTGGTDSDPLADTSNQKFEVVDEWHRKLWNFKSSLGHYIGYHYFIDKSGTVTQGRADSDTGAHTKGMNGQSIGICLAGNFDVTMPTAAQTRSLKTLLDRLMPLYGLSPESIVPHRRFANKTCYGTKLSDKWAADLVTGDTPPQPCTLKNFTTVELLTEVKKRLTGLGT